ncbi:hypothetical protein ACLKA7_004322 [Drosophila subpalustris]
MSKLFQICLLSLALVVQCVLSEDPVEGINNHIRDQLQKYEKFLATDDGSHKEDLQKLITIYESALKSESFDEKQQLVKETPQKFSAEFGAFVQSKLQDAQLTEDIGTAITFYKNLLKGDEHKADIEKAIADLDGLLKLTDFEAKKNGFLNIESTFSPEFVNFLKKDSVPKINHDLQKAVEFFTKVLADSDVQFATEVKALKAQAEGALADGVNSATGRTYPSDTCVGLSKRYQVCNDLPCPANSNDIRAHQCAAFDKVDFQGQQYSWEPYIKDDAECELNCKPLGMKYFATLNDTVIDGTPCQRPAEYYRSKSTYASRAMCVDGICKAVLSSGSIKGLYANSGSVSCGGLLCRPVTGIFTRDPLPEDAYVHVSTIPAGASNISITELKNSANLLVLRTSEQKSIFNGENEISESGSYEAVGTTFDYHRIDGVQHGEGVTEWITSTGPIKEAVELWVYSNILNPGIKYEYLLPIVSDSEENELSLESSDGFLRSGPGSEDGSSSVSSTRSGRRRKFNWKVVGFSACTKSCGGGTQSPIVRCARENPVRYYSQRRCSHSEKPVLNENLLHCNTQPCPAYWRQEEWGECRCQHGESVRRRELNCVQELASGIVIHVDKAACMEEQPPSEKQCECPKDRPRKSGRYRMHSNPNSNPANGTHIKRNRTQKKVGDAVWLMSEWNQYCSTSCGPGVQYRTIFCDRPKTKAERCEPRDIPENRRPCKQTACELGDWFTGPWSPCSGDCFNLTRSRPVLCIKSQLITDDEECNADLKPQLMENCSHEEIAYCAPRWHYSEWSECTKSCDGGTQRRSVKCLEYDEKLNALRESNKCRYALREPIYRNCNTQKCEDLTNELLQNDEAAECLDHFPNCKWAVQAKLCSYDYYRDNCCISCTKLH